MNAWLPRLCGIVLPPGGASDTWPSWLVWLHTLADVLIALSLLSIPLTLAYVVRIRREMTFPRFAYLVGALVIGASAMHFVAAVAPWSASLDMAAGITKFITAVLLLTLAVVLWRHIPTLIQLPNPEVLRKHNEALEQNIGQRMADLDSANQQLRREITQREDAEAEVNRLNNELRVRFGELQAIFDIMPVGIGIADHPSCRNIRTNRAFATMLGIEPKANASLSAPPDEAPRNFRVLHEGRPLLPAELPMQRCGRENVVISNFEETIERTDGTRLDVIVNVIPLRNAEGAAIGCVATFQDITAHKRAEQQRLAMDHKLLEMQKLESLGVLAGGIAHDFNNLLTGVLGNASLARSDIPAGSSASNCLQQIEHSAIRAADLCKQMLAYSGKGRFIIQQLNLNQVLTDITQLIQISVSKKAQLRFNLAPVVPTINADATQLRQLIMNLVLNAAEAIGERPGHISLATGVIDADAGYLAGTLSESGLPPGRYVSFEVTDDGSGIRREDMTKIFDPFYTTKFTGRGLGLAAALGIVRGHKGAIKVYSELGRGTTFKVLLPAAEGQAPIARMNAPAPSGWRGTGDVLVVDDEESVRLTLANLLKALGFNPTVTHDGHEGLALFQISPERFRLVLLDLTMPGLDGEEVFRRLRQIKPGVRVVLMSGFNMVDAINRFTGKGLAGFVQKPFTLDSLSAELRRTLETTPPA